MVGLAQSCKLPQESDIIFGKQAHIIDLVLQHGHALNAHAKSKACVRLRVNVAIRQYLRVHHASANDFYPAGVLTNMAL